MRAMMLYRMMLDRQCLRVSKRRSVRCRDILRMQIVRHHKFFGAHLIHRYQVLDRLPERPPRWVVSQVADVLADKGLAIDHEGNGILQIGAHRQNRPLARDGCDRPRSISACPSQNDWTERSCPRYRVIHPARYGTLPNQKCVGDSRKSVKRLFIFISDGFTRSIGARHHQRFRRTRRKQQMMQWSVRQHHSEIVVIGSNPCSNLAGFRFRWRQHDGSRCRSQQPLRVF